MQPNKSSREKKKVRYISDEEFLITAAEKLPISAALATRHYNFASYQNWENYDNQR